MLRHFSFGALVAVAGTAVSAQNVAADQDNQIGPAPQRIAEYSFAPMDLALERDRAEQLRAVDGLNRFADPRDVDLTPWNSGTITQLQNGRVAWSLMISAPNALNINLGTRFDLPASATIWLIDENGNAAIEPLTAANNRPHGEHWTPPVAGAGLEVYAEMDEAEFEAFADGFAVNRISRGFMGWLGNGAAGAQGVDQFQAVQLPCNVDVACSQADDWRLQVDSVVAYASNGFLTCSGAIVNNTAEDQTPYVLTAWHCLNGGAGVNFNSIIVAFNYQNSTCRIPGSSASGDPGDDSFSQQTLSGAIFRMSHNESDTLLFELQDPIPVSFGAEYVGWSRSAALPGPGVGIHHPGVEEKRISVENGNPQNGTWTLGIAGQPTIFGWSLQFDEGILEGGSSGSPYFDAAGRVRGVASGVGGGFTCSGAQSQVYGGVDDGWNGGGTSATRLRDWLDPVGTNPVFFDALGSFNGLQIQPVNFPTELTPGAPETFEVEIDLGDETLATPPTLLFRGDSGASFSTAVLVNTDGDLYEATLPAFDCDEEPEFFISAVGTVTGVSRFPASGNAQAIVTNGSQVEFSDDGEIDLGYTVSGDATDGQWTLGVPLNNGRGDPVADFDGSGSAWLTDNSAADGGNSDVDNGTTFLTTPPIDLSEDSIVTFAYWFNDIASGAVQGGDAFTVEISTNGGTTFSLVRSFSTASNAWRTDTLTEGVDYNAAAPGLGRLRFGASDIGTQNVIEAGVDAIVVTTRTCETDPQTPCNAADITEPFGILDLTDVDAFIAAFGAGDSAADVAAPFGVLDLTDVDAFIAAFLAGCP
ncbi:MAG: GC-type dockerin domain-anchored protein [Planctomycetota bacterium]